MSTGTVQLTVSGQQGTVNFLWSNGATTQNISALSAGFYSVSLNDSLACTDQIDSIEVDAPAPFVLSAQVFDLSCNNDSSGQILISFSGNQGNSSFV